MSFWKELSRRNVVKVGIAYAVAAWLIIHPVDIIFPILNLPKWSITLVTAFLIICFPFVLIFSWVYEMTPEGLKLTKDVPPSKSITHLTGKRLNYILAGLLLIAVAYIIFSGYYLEPRFLYILVGLLAITIAYIIFNKYYLKPHLIVAQQVPVVTNVAKPQKTIAVLPFVDLSPQKDQEYFVDGLSEELLNSLTKISDLRVIARTSSFSFKGSNKTIQEIAGVLGVENILEGSVRKAGNALRITAQLVKAVDGSHLWSKTYDRELKEIFKVQEDIATAVADELKATLGFGKSFKQLGGTDNPKAYELYLIAKGQYNKLIKGPHNKFIEELALESLDSAIALDSEFALAWASKSIIHTWLSISGPANHAAAEQNAAIHAAQNAIELEPNMAAGYYALGYAKSNGGDFIGARLAYSNALELTDELPSFIQPVVPIHYNVVGFFERANELLEEMLITDPLNFATRGWYMFSFIFLGNTQRALEENENMKRVLYEGGQEGDWGLPYVHLWTGNIVTRNGIDSYDTLWGSPDLIFKAAMEHLDSPKEAIEIIRKKYADKKYLSSWQLCNIAYWSTYFADLELAMEAMEESIRITPENIYTFYFPLMKEFRQMPRFKELIKKVGLVDYWNKFGWPDICHKLDNGDFECD
jgi:adenylate cyclase